MTPSTSPQPIPSDWQDLAQLQLQQELKSLFEVDTFKDLQAYLNLADNLCTKSWTKDIQSLYRFIHTIKGGAATVGADAILPIAIALEDLLSDLRYLDTAPALEDGQLGQMLLEGGELLASVISLEAVVPTTAVEPKVKRLQVLREQIQATYLNAWSEQTQLHCEFAQEGFDLVVLDLEIALEQLPDHEFVPDDILNLAQELLEQLEQIGEELQLATGWSDLLQEARSLLMQPEGTLWRSQWTILFQKLKTCAKQGGQTVKVPSSLSPESSKPESLIPERVENNSQETIQIPVPLERLDLSAQHLIDTLLATRATQGNYQTLYFQVLQLVALAQNNVQYITHLRQLQDDYALLDNLKSQTGEIVRGLTPERYRKGYTTINRLLENSLRMAELGAETEQTARKTSEKLQQLDRQILRLRDTIEDSRLVPFQNLLLRARAILRDLTTRYDKPAQLVVHGESLELDVGTVKVLEPALLHLIRNAYDHGLESSAERVAQGKSESGTLSLSLQRRGSTYLLTLQDDGRGLDAQAIQARAKALGLPLTQTQTLSDLLAVLCQPGFSSQSQVSDLSGRGVGMDVVATQVLRLGGKLSLDTCPGSGTTFRLKFPVPHLLVSCLLVLAGERTFAIPTEQIVNTALLGQLAALPKDNLRCYYDWEIGRGTMATPGLDLLTYWHPRSNARSLADTAICVYVRAEEGSGIWLLADKLLGQFELSIQSLPSPLLSPNGLMGVSLQPDGTLIPVLEVATLVEQLLHSPCATPVTSSVAEASRPEIVQSLALQILVIDDAALMRRRIEASLSAYGYLSVSCADGLEAWHWLQNNPHPDLIITDIEMPNMDGFTLIEQCRQAGITIPILVISSRLAQEWSKEAQRLGATNFLTKGFSTTELINQVQACLSGL